MASSNGKVLVCCGGLAFICLWLALFGRRANTRMSNNEDTHTFHFASYYQDEMVLQAAPHRPVIWGYGNLGAKVEIQVNIYSVYKTTVTESIGGVGVWSVTLDPQAPGTRAVISGSQMYIGTLETDNIKDVVFGDVWICGGQSNMVFPVGHMFNASEELQKVHDYTDVRIFRASQVQSDVPLIDLQGIGQNWAKPTKENAQFFSAVCWLFGRHLHDTLKVPIGLISTNWGGTAVELWSSPQALEACGVKRSYYHIILSKSSYDYENLAMANSALWNAMIHPFLNMTIKGAIWYQGEANEVHNNNLYNCTFPAMIKDWRQSWYEATNRQTEETFPFGFVQLATQTIPSENDRFPLIRWHQTADFGQVPNSAMPGTFMAVSLDLRDPLSPYGSIHPRDKQDVGRRLADAALSHSYRVRPIEEGPFPMYLFEEKNNIVIIYQLANLKITPNVSSNFEICCSGNRCEVSDLTPQGLAEWMPAYVSSYSNSEIRLDVKSCPNGVKRVRYAWTTDPCMFKKCQVYSEFGYPAPPFVLDIMNLQQAVWL